MSLITRLQHYFSKSKQPSPQKNATPATSPRTERTKHTVVTTLSNSEPDKKLLVPLEEDILPGDIILLDWSNNKYESITPPQYFKYDYGIDASEHRKMLIRRELLHAASPSESLKALLIPQLKEILRENGEKVSGKKQELIDRITTNLDENQFGENISEQVLVCTPIGTKLLKKYNNLVWAHKNKSTDGTISVANALNNSIQSLQEASAYARSTENLSKQMLTELQDLDAKNYEILGTLDKETCLDCGQMDGKIFQTSKINFGVNFPPFHDGCRCTVVPHHSGLPASTIRTARNPQTGKSESIPNQSYTEWRKSMIKQYGEETFR